AAGGVGDWWKYEINQSERWPRYPTLNYFPEFYSQKTRWLLTNQILHPKQFHNPHRERHLRQVMTLVKVETTHHAHSWSPVLAKEAKDEFTGVTDDWEECRSERHDRGLQITSLKEQPDFPKLTSAHSETRNFLIWEFHLCRHIDSIHNPSQPGAANNADLDVRRMEVGGKVEQEKLEGFLEDDVGLS
ncbi:hypothetical protein BC938DRAFT_482168, partial [Jimgerdemannia flammicorona]